MKLAFIYGKQPGCTLTKLFTGSACYLDHKLDTDEHTYGWRDYLLFALRPLYHLFGQSTRNADGLICCEMVADDLRANGWTERAILGRKDPPSPRK